MSLSKGAKSTLAGSSRQAQFLQTILSLRLGVLCGEYL